MKWVKKYLSIQYKDMNCSKFVEHVLREQFHRDYEFPQTKGSIFEQSALIKKSLPSFCEKTNNPCDGDLVLMHGMRRMCHVGLYLKIKGQSYVLHCEKKMTCAALHSFADIFKYGYTVEGVYKWQR